VDGGTPYGVIGKSDESRDVRWEPSGTVCVAPGTQGLGDGPILFSPFATSVAIT